jgi:proteasome lid subunit RPN8/RPN11
MISEQRVNVLGGGSLSSSPFSSGSCASWAEAALLVGVRASLTKVDTLLAERLQATTEELRVSALIPSRKEAERALAHALMLAELRRDLALVRDRSNRGQTVPLYIVSSLFLAESFRYLVRDPAEDMHFVTGCELGPVRVLERLVDFDKAERTTVRVAGKPASTHQALIGLEAKGHRLTAWMHSHPGLGAGATRPSSTDLDHQRRLEQGRYPAIGAIFSRDGWVRFFSAGTPFRVDVFGAGVRRADERVYQLDVA